MWCIVSLAEGAWQEVLAAVVHQHQHVVSSLFIFDLVAIKIINRS